MSSYEEKLTADIMKPEDLDRVWELEKMLFSDAWTRANLEDTFRFPSYRAMVVRDKESRKAMGYLLFMAAADEGELLRIGVDPSCRKRGIGQALMEAMETYAREQEITVIFLEVRESNLPARSLYEKNGFVLLGIRKNYYHDPTEHAVLMSHSL